MDISIAGGSVRFSAGRKLGLEDLARVRELLATFAPFESAVVDLSAVMECDRETLEVLASEVRRIPLVRFQLATRTGRLARWLRKRERSLAADRA